MRVGGDVEDGGLVGWGRFWDERGAGPLRMGKCLAGNYGICYANLELNVDFLFLIYLELCVVFGGGV